MSDQSTPNPTDPDDRHRLEAELAGIRAVMTEAVTVLDEVTENSGGLADYFTGRAAFERLIKAQELLNRIVDRLCERAELSSAATSPTASNGRPPIFVCVYAGCRTTFYLDRGEDPNATPIALSIHVDGDDPLHAFVGEALPIAAIPGQFFGAVVEHDRRAALYSHDVAAGACEEDEDAGSVLLAPLPASEDEDAVPAAASENNGDKAANSCNRALATSVLINHWHENSQAGRYFSHGYNPTLELVSVDVMTGGGADSTSEAVRCHSFRDLPPEVFGLACRALPELLEYAGQLKPEEPAAC